ncbi:MAG TPA: zinc-dependent metalloprotease family protein [Saprospiraceae bacterium]|nr:zinc-dependent metalloprotease family protein [Saprospiraceae bacterium]
MKITLGIVLLLLGFTQSFAQSRSLWTDKPVTEMRLPAGQAGIAEGRKLFPLRYRTAGLDINSMRSLLTSAPDEVNVSPSFSSVILEVPIPDGGLDSFRLVEYSMMEPGLANRYPDIRTFRGVSLHDPFKTIRCDWTVKGFSAIIMTRSGRYHVEPFARGNQEDYIIFYKRDYPAPAEPFVCGTESLEPERPDDHQIRVSGDCTFRSYRLAVATTGEYSNYFGAESDAEEDIVLSEVVIAVNRINGVYEKDVAVRMLLIENTTEVFYYNPATDPYSGGACTQLGQNQTTMTNVIGSGNYDIGHVFGVGSGGCASTGVCLDSNKARGATGTTPPDGDLFYIDYVAHEIGHQFGASHTFNNYCNGNRVNSSAYEPGSGSTIMAYAGICDPNVQNNSDDYFHSRSIFQINSYITSGNGNDCDVPITWSNSAPVLTEGADYTIPKSTPFMLTAIATDADEDPLTYCWEQWDQEIGSMPPTSTNTLGPMFRSLDPDPSPTRYFPRLQDLVNNISPVWEVLPSVTRNMEFRITVRDYHEGMAGCVDEDNINVNSTSMAGPFIVTNPNTSSVLWHEGATETVTWNVANTTNSPVSCVNVDILLSYDGGFTYPATLLSNTPNDGSQNIVVPYGLSTTARVMVKGRNHVFFDISNQNFEIRCSLIVTSNADSGNGSLRNVLVCASPGDSITFAPALFGATITLLSPIVFTEDVVISSAPVENITLSGTMIVRPIEVLANTEVSIAGLWIIGGTGPTGCALLINGDVKLTDVTVEPGPQCGKSLILNFGTFTLEGNCQIAQ